MALPWAALGGGVSSAIGAWYSERSAEKRQHQAQDFSAQQYATRYQTQVKDLKAAGLNPMLAYQQGPGSAPSGAVAGPGPQPDIAGGAASASTARAQIKQMDSVTQKTNAETDKTMQDAKTSQAQEDNLRQDTLVKAGMPEYYAAMVTQALQSAQQSKVMIENIQTEKIKLEQEIKNLKVQQEKDKTNIQLNNSIIERNQMLNGLTLSEQMLKNAEARHVSLQADVTQPKAAAAKLATGKGAAIAENIWKFINPFRR